MSVIFFKKNKLKTSRNVCVSTCIGTHAERIARRWHNFRDGCQIRLSTRALGGGQLSRVPLRRQQPSESSQKKKHKNRTQHWFKSHKRRTITASHLHGVARQSMRCNFKEKLFQIGFFVVRRVVKVNAANQVCVFSKRAQARSRLQTATTLTRRSLRTTRSKRACLK